MSVSVNGTLVGEAQFAGKAPYRMSLSLPASLLREGANDLSLTNVADTGVSSLVFLDRFSLAHPQTSSLTNGVFEGTWAESGTATVAASGAVAVLDVTDAATGTGGARWLSGTESSGGSLRFRAEAGRRYVAVAQGCAAHPARRGTRAIQPARDHEPGRLHPRRAEGLPRGRRAARRAAAGPGPAAARAVAFEEIASEFGHGQASAEAIQSFLAYAFQSWARPSPRYVLLLGDASYDPRNFIGTSQPSPLPALWTKTSYLWTVSDPLLAAVNGDDALPDLAIGRLPAATLEQAQALVAKLLAWEDSGQGLNGAAALVADNPDIAGDFEADADDIAQSFFQGRPVSTLKLAELGAATRPAILDALNSGLSHLGYVGHGGARRLGERERLELLRRAEPSGPVAAAVPRHDELPQRLLRRSGLRLALGVAAEGRRARRDRVLLAERPDRSTARRTSTTARSWPLSRAGSTQGSATPSSPRRRPTRIRA